MNPSSKIVCYNRADQLFSLLFSGTCEHTHRSVLNQLKINQSSMFGCGLRVVLLYARELRKCLEVAVAVVEHERMLKHEGRNPDVVGRDRCTLLTQLPVHVRIMRPRGIDRCNDWCRAPASLPQFLIDSILRRQGAVERAIAVPGACNVTEIALPATLRADAGAPSQGFDGHLIEALALFVRPPAEGGVQIIWHFPDSILHASIVGYVGI